MFTNEPIAIKKYNFKKKTSIDQCEVHMLEALRPKSDIHGDAYQNNYIIHFKESFIVEKLISKRSNFELWIVQEFCECGDLFHVMRTLKRPFTLIEVKHLLSNILLGLNFIHSRKIVHRDLKGLNILLTRTGRVKICDFGHAERVNYDKEHEIIESRVTDLWMAPEMFKDGSYYGFEVDIWALGICLIEMLTMKPPFIEQNGDMVGSCIMNLPDICLEQQREQLNLEKPPLDLTERDESRANNYWNFYTEEYKFKRYDSEVEETNTEGIKLKHLSILEHLEAENKENGEEEDLESHFDISDEDNQVKSNIKSRLRTKTGGSDITYLTDKSFRFRRKGGNNKTGKKKKRKTLLNMVNKNNIRKVSSALNKSGPISITIKSRKDKDRKRHQQGGKRIKSGRKKVGGGKRRKMVTELFASSLKRKESKMLEKKKNKEIEAKKRALKNRKIHRTTTNKTEVTTTGTIRRRSSLDFIELAKEDDKVQLNEFIAWCLATSQFKRPTVHDLIQHPFVNQQTVDLIKTERTECRIDAHSDIFLRAHILHNSKEIENLELQALRNKGECECSESQNYIRENICDEFVHIMKENNVRKSRVLA